MFVAVRRVVDLPLSFADVRRIDLDEFPKLCTVSFAMSTRAALDLRTSHHPPLAGSQGESARGSTPIKWGPPLGVDSRSEVRQTGCQWKRRSWGFVGTRTLYCHIAFSTGTVGDGVDGSRPSQRARQ
jgi:hypothetical protein